MRKKLIVVSAIALLAVSVTVAAASVKATLINSNGDKVVVAAGSKEAQKHFGNGYVLMGSPFEGKCECDTLGAMSPDVFIPTTFHEGIMYKEMTKSIAATSIYATTTLQVADSGTTYYLSASGTRITLPAVARSRGVNFRFVVGGAIDTASTTIASAEGDNIEGTLLVAGAVVDCGAEDFIILDHIKENVGDYVEVRSNGTNWFIGDSGILTALAGECTDPS